MRKLLLFTSFIALNAPSYAADMSTPSSLFFSPEEIQKIEALNNDQTAPVEPAEIHLGAVLYYGANDWTIWLDDARWTPATRRADLQITKVEPNVVHISWLASPAAQPQLITLHSYQTYRTATGQIVEGKH